MKTHLSWIRVTAVAAVTAVGLSGQAVGQYIPFNGVPQHTNAVPYGVQPQRRSAYQPTQQQAAATANPYAPQPQQQTQQYQTTQYPASPYAAPQYQASAPQYQAPQYQTPNQTPTAAAQPWTRQAAPNTDAQQFAQQPFGQQPYGQQPYGQSPMNVAMMHKDETLPTPEPATSGNTMDGSVMTGQPSYDGGYGSNGSYQEGCNCSSPYPTTSAYPTTGCTEGYYNSGGTDYGIGNYFDSGCGGPQWFGGVYWLFMTRDNPDFQRLTVEVDTASVAYPYYPPADTTALAMPHADHDYRSGFEVRFGSTFSTGGGYDTGCDPYGCGSGYGYGSGYGGYGGGCDPCACASTQDYAWEVGYWFLDDDINTAQVVDGNPTDDFRLYGQKNFAGWEYDRDGGGYRPVNDYYDYQIPVTMPNDPPVDGDVRVLAQRVRTNFQAQNLELNFLRLPVVCGSTCGYGSYGYDQCGGYGACDSCEPTACGSPFSITGLCGVRYVRLDDDVEYATEFGVYDGGALDNPTFDGWDYSSDNELFYDVNVDNHLVGFQLGANMNYCISCKCNLFWDSNFGIYNNHMNSYQRLYNGGGGDVRFVNGGGNASVRTNKDDIAFLGEMRIGGAYNFTSNWRGLIAYRAIGISGVALSVDQWANDASNAAQLGLIDSDGSIIIHGVQVGVECRY